MHMAQSPEHSKHFINISCCCCVYCEGLRDPEEIQFCWVVVRGPCSLTSHFLSVRLRKYHIGTHPPFFQPFSFRPSLISPSL